MDDDYTPLTIGECLKIVSVVFIFFILFAVGAVFESGILQIFFAFSATATFALILILVHDATKYGERK